MRGDGRNYQYQVVPNPDGSAQSPARLAEGAGKGKALERGTFVDLENPGRPAAGTGRREGGCRRRLGMGTPSLGFADTCSKARCMNATAFLPASALVALGGALGAWLRFATARLWTAAIGAQAANAFPWATLTVNALGSLGMGLLAGWLAQRGAGGEQWRLFVGVGVLGGYTTFSAFSLELIALVERGAPGLALFYAAVSLLAGCSGLVLGLTMMRSAT